jgi:hypothetical protein
LRHAKAIALAGHRQHSGLAGGEGHRVAVGPKLGQRHEAAGQGRVAAQIDLDRRGEPAQLEVGAGGAPGDQKRRLGQVVLGGDRGHHRVVWPALEHALLPENSSAVKASTW